MILETQFKRRAGWRCPAALMRLIGIAAIALAAPVWSAGGAQELETDSQHRGLVSFGDFQIFPENRFGNGVYLNNRLIFSLPEEAVVYILPLPQVGRMIYISQNTAGEIRLGVMLGAGDPEPRVTQVGSNFYHVVMVVGGVVYKKVYRVATDNTVVDVLPRSKTPDGLTLGPGGLLFYHVASVSQSERDGKSVSTFALRLHLLPSNDEPLKNLGYPIENQLPRLEMEWIDENRIRYRLADGREGTLSVSQFQ